MISVIELLRKWECYFLFEMAKMFRFFLCVAADAAAAAAADLCLSLTSNKTSIDLFLKVVVTNQ